MKAIRSAYEGVSLVDAFEGAPEEFELVVPLELLDQLGITMAIITDRVLARGWEPAGYSDHGQFRTFRFRELA